MAEEWIGKLKPGDKVLREHNFMGASLVTVKKILPSGRIRFENGEMMDASGRHCCQERFCGVLFTEWNDERKKEMRIRKMRRFLSDFKWKSLSDEQIESVYAVVSKLKLAQEKP